MFIFLNVISYKLSNFVAVKTRKSVAQTVRSSSVIGWGDTLARQMSRQVHCSSFNSDGVMEFSTQNRILCLGN